MTEEQWAILQPVLSETLALSPGQRGLHLATILGDNQEMYLLARRLVQLAASGSLADNLPPEFGGWRALISLGQTGIGEDFLAERSDGTSDRLVTLRFSNAMLPDPASIQNFYDEVKRLAMLYDNSIGRILDAGLVGSNQPFLVTEFVAGIPIDESTRNMKTREIVQLFRKVLTSVDYAHQRQVWHGDLRPANVLVGVGQSIHLADFALSRTLSPGEDSVGALDKSSIDLYDLLYASPEQIRGKGLTPSTDIYALGVILYQLLGGVPPYGQDETDVMSLARAICEKVPAKIEGLDADLNYILQKALEKNSMGRYASVTFFAEDLDRWLQGRGVTASEGAVRDSMLSYARRNWITLALILLVLITGVSAIFQRGGNVKAGQIQKATDGIFAKSLAAKSGAKAPAGPPETPVQSAKKYLDKMLEENGNKPAVQEELAKAYLRLAEAEIHGFGSPRIDRGMAIQASRRSYELTILVLDQNKNVPLTDQQALDYTQSAVMLTKLLREARDYKEAARITQEWQDRLSKVSSTNPSVMKAKALANTTMADLLYESGQTQDSVKVAKDAMTQYGQVYAADKSNDANGREYANAARSVGTKSMAMNNFVEAISAFRTSEKVLREQAEKPKSEAAPLIDLAKTLSGLGEALEKTKQNGEAKASYKEARQLLEQAAKRDANNAEVLSGLADNLIHMARFSLEERKLEASLLDAERAIEILRKLLTNINSEADLRRQLALALTIKGEIFLAQKNKAEAIPLFTDALAQWDNFGRISGLRASEESEIARLRLLASR
jgi:eukaryotic-like serine/threonine-protein kinase